MLSEIEIRLPDIGDFDAVEVIEIAVASGDEVEVEDTLITLESDKATMDIPSPNAGRIKTVQVNIGDNITEGAAIVILEKSAVIDDLPNKALKQKEETDLNTQTQHDSETSNSSNAKADNIQIPSKSVETKAHSEAEVLNETQNLEKNADQKIHASPSIRRYARELGVPLNLVKGSGTKGRILKDDVKAFTKAVMSGEQALTKDKTGFSLPEIPSIDFSKFGPTKNKALSRLKRISGQNLHRSWITVPHVTQFDEADISDLEAFRKSKKTDAEQHGTKLTLLSFLMKAVVIALKKYPEFNSSLSPDGESIILKNYFHIGVAVNTDAGLMVPVVKDADKKGLYDLAKELAELAQKAREKKLSPAEMQGACFTISSLGHIGGTGFTPIVNTPEVAIMGISKGVIKPVFLEDQFVPRLILPFSLSYDHRVIDGVAAAEFTRELSKLLTDIRDILL